MSNATALGLIIANFVPLFFLFLYAAKMTNDVAAEIETGVVRGVTVSTKYRRIMLYSIWSGYVTGVTVVGVFAAIVNTRIAAYATEGDIRTVAYVAATISAVGAAGWVANAIPELIHYRSTLRQAEAE